MNTTLYLWDNRICQTEISLMEVENDIIRQLEASKMGTSLRCYFPDGHMEYVHVTKIMHFESVLPCLDEIDH